MRIVLTTLVVDEILFQSPNVHCALGFHTVGWVVFWDWLVVEGPRGLWCKGDQIRNKSSHPITEDAYIRIPSYKPGEPFSGKEGVHLAMHLSKT